MRGFNGKSLVDEWAAEQSDTSSAHLSRVLTYVNDGILDIASRHGWKTHRRKGKKILTASAEEQELKTTAPTAPSVAVSSGGSLTDATVFNVYVTYVDSNGYETPAGTASANVTTASPNLQIDVTSIPVSPEPLVTARNLYLQKASGNILYSQQVADNTTTTATIDEEPTDSDVTARPPEYDQIRKLDGDPFFEGSPELQLVNRTIDQMRYLHKGSFSDGTPQIYGLITDTNLLLNPRPSSALTLSYYYFKRPPMVTYQTTSIPDLIPELKPLLRFYVMMRGFEFRDRNGAVSKYNQYEAMVLEYISRFGQRRDGRKIVSDRVGDSDGYETTSL